MDLLNEDGTVRTHLRREWRLEGPTWNGEPNGTWKATFECDGSMMPMLLEYRNGQPVDLRWRDERQLATLNGFRKLRGLPSLTAHDFPGEINTKEKHGE